MKDNAFRGAGMTVYIHYGADAFDPELFSPIRNGTWNTKPREGTGLWASRENDPFGWSAWCRENRYSVQSLKQFFRFTVSADSNILILEDPEQLIQLYSPNPCCIDFEELVRNGIDAVELTNCGAFRDSLDIWDCNCILIMNPEIIVPE